MQVSKFIMPEEIFRKPTQFNANDCLFRIRNGWDTPLLEPTIDLDEIESLTGIPVIDKSSISVFELHELLTSSTGLCPDTQSKISLFQEFIVKSTSPLLQNWFVRSLRDVPGEDNCSPHEEIARTLMQCVDIYITSFRRDYEKREEEGDRSSTAAIAYSQFSLVILCLVAMMDALFLDDDSLRSLHIAGFSPAIFQKKKLLERLQGLVFPRKEYMDLADAVTNYFLSASAASAATAAGDAANRQQYLSYDADKEHLTVSFASEFAKSRSADHVYHELFKSERDNVITELEVLHIFIMTHTYILIH
jgi:hypothetical protein